MNWELDALKMLAKNPTVPGIALKDAIGEIERLEKVYRMAVTETVNATQEIMSLKHVVSECEDNLKSMVEQYCRNAPFIDGTPDTFSHDFMSAGECTFEYLVARGLAEYIENGVDIRFNKLDVVNA